MVILWETKFIKNKTHKVHAMHYLIMTVMVGTMILKRTILDIKNYPNEKSETRPGPGHGQGCNCDAGDTNIVVKIVTCVTPGLFPCLMNPKRNDFT